MVASLYSVGNIVLTLQVLDELLHWVLLNTDARKSVEAVVGKIHHSTATAKAECMEAEQEKAERR